MDKSLSKKEYFLSITAIIFLVFFFVVINQEQKDGQDVGQEPPVEATGTKTPVLPKISPPKSKTDCEIETTVYFQRDWIHACYLKDLLTEPCKEIFNIDGYYLYDNDSNRWIEPRVTYIDYITDAKLCACRLPNDVATGLNSSQQSSLLRCSKFPY